MKSLLIFAVLVHQIFALNVWPYPQSVSAGAQTAQVSTAFKFVGTTDPILHAAFQRYINYIFFARPELEPEISVDQPEVVITALSVSVSNVNVPLAYGVDESYTLMVGATNVLQANTVWGALRGLETFSQLVEYNQTTTQYFIEQVPLKITDEPRFSWRGLLIDTSRHYQTRQSLLKQLNALSFNKMNVFHWHITDDQSFPLLTKKFPELARKGAWAPKAVYTESEVKQIVDHALNHGIRVVPEFDMPAHAGSWAKGRPDIFPNCPGEYLMIDPTNEGTYTFLTEFLTEVSAWFPDQFIHFGSDESQYDCWKADPSIAQWMKQHGISSYVGLHNYFVQRVQNIGHQLNKTVVFWEEAFDLNLTLNPSTVVQVWKDPATLSKVINAGHPGLLSGGYYLDQQQPGSEDFYLWEDTWIDFYINDPVGNHTYTPQELSLIMGGEACMWGEQVDETVIDGRIWPRAAAVAERLWSPQSVNDVDEATPRLGTQRCRMVRRGINASPIYPDYCFHGSN